MLCAPQICSFILFKDHLFSQNSVVLSFKVILKMEGYLYLKYKTCVGDGRC